MQQSSARLVPEAAYARHAIAKGSKSFAAASKLLPMAVRDDVARLYAWCRYCDDVIDGQTLGYGGGKVEDANARLAELIEATDAALEGRPTGQSVFDGFGSVARAHSITPRLAHDLLEGFGMDVEERTYRTADDLAAYCYGVAGAVGVMMALVLGVAADDHDTLDRACDLGLAFQMTNIARDVTADAHAGRIYLPSDWLEREGVEADPDALADPRNAAQVFAVTARLVETAEAYYKSARIGIARLPYRTAWAIASASAVYRAIGAKRRRGGPQLLATRVGTTRIAKLRIIGRAGLIAALPDRPNGALSRDGLWQRPPRP